MRHKYIHNIIALASCSQLFLYSSKLAAVENSSHNPKLERFTKNFKQIRSLDELSLERVKNVGSLALMMSEFVLGDQSTSQGQASAQAPGHEQKGIGLLGKVGAIFDEGPHLRASRYGTKQAFLGDDDAVESLLDGLSRSTLSGTVVVGPVNGGKTSLILEAVRRMDRGELAFLGDEAEQLKSSFLLPIDTDTWIRNNDILGDLDKFFSILLPDILGKTEKEWGSQTVVLYFPHFSGLLSADLSVAGKVEQVLNEFTKNMDKLPAAYKKRIKLLFEADDDAIDKFKVKLPKLAQVIDRVDVPTPQEYLISFFKTLAAKPGAIPLANEKIIEELAEYTPSLYPGKSLYLAAEKAFDDIQTLAKRTGVRRIDHKFLYDMLKDRIGLPFDPRSAESREAFRVRFIDYLKTYIENQDEAIEKVVDGIIRFYSDPKKRVHQIIMMGSTGVGKTELMERAAEFLFGSGEDYILTGIAGSAFQTDGNRDLSASTLTGGANGKKGLIPAFLDRIQGRAGAMYLDEWEKFANFYRTLFMQFQDKGVFMGHDGPHWATKVIVFSATNKNIEALYAQGNQAGHWTEKDLKDFFAEPVSRRNEDQTPPREELNRIDQWIAFNRHEYENGTRIAVRKFAPVIQELENLGYKVSYTDRLIQAMTLAVFDEVNGARDVYKQKEIFREWCFQAIDQEGIQPATDLETARVITIDLIPDLNTATSKIGYRVGRQRKLRVIEKASEGPDLRSTNPVRDLTIQLELKKLKDADILGQKLAWENLIATYRANRLSNRVGPQLAYFFADATLEVPLAFYNTVHGFEPHDRRLLDQENHIDLARVVTKSGALDQGELAEILGLSNVRAGSSKPRPGKLEKLFQKGNRVLLFTNFDALGEHTHYVMTQLESMLSGASAEFNGTNYPLKDKLVVFTTRSLVEQFAIIDDDDYRIETWEKALKRQSVQSYLYEVVPPRLLRNAPIYLAKPMVLSEVRRTAEQLLALVMSDYQNENIDIELSDNFFDVLSKVFWNADFAEDRIRRLFLEKVRDVVVSAVALREHSFDGYEPFPGKTSNQSDLKIRLSLRDDALETYDQWTPWQEKTFEGRSTILDAEIHVDNTHKKTLRLQVEDVAIPFSFNDKAKNHIIAGHEVGHALGSALSAVRGQPTGSFEFTTIKPVQMRKYTAAGVAFSQPHTRNSAAHTRWQKIVAIAQGTMGTVGEILRDGNQSEGWRSDLENAVEETIERLKSFRIVVYQKDGDPSETLKAAKEKEQERLLMESYLYGLGMLQSNYKYWQKATDHLTEHLSMRQDEFFMIGNQVYDEEFPMPVNKDEFAECIKLFL